MKSKRRTKKAKKERTNEYIPGLAAFKFDPTEDWDAGKAQNLFETSVSKIKKTDAIRFEDCTLGMSKMPNECVDLVIADPPFGINFSNSEQLYNRDPEYVVSDYHEVDLNYGDFTLSWISKLPRLMKKTSSAYIFSGWNNLEYVLSAARDSGLTLLNHIIWTFQFGAFTQKKFVSSHYHILLYIKDPKAYYYNKIEHYPLDSWDLKRKYSRGESKNSTKLPLELVQKCIDFSSKPGDLVFDPFMGNGTTAVAAKGSYRHYYGFEINKNLKKTIDNNIKSTKLGSIYREYKTLKPTIEELKKKYPRAYKIHNNKEKSEED